jgi:6-methylsalicylate decarboxylase
MQYRGLTAGSCDCCVATDATRRRFLSGAAALVVGAALARPVWAQATSPAATPKLKQLVDIHHHFSPPFYIPELTSRHTDQKPLVEWTTQKTLDIMGEAGITTAMMSISEPGVWFGDNAHAVKLARQTNEWGMQMVHDYPGKFGLFASLPIPDIDASLKEIAYAYDTLRADGICMMTSYGGKYLGDPSITPVLEELNRRKAVVFTHPVKAPCCVALVPGVGPNTIELATDTARAIASLLFSGSLTRFPDIRFIFSHAGGTLPSLMGRILAQAASMPNAKTILPNGPIPELQKLYYDTANAGNPWALAPLLKLVQTSQIVYGTDFPFRSPQTTSLGLTDTGYFNTEQMLAINSGNTTGLIPRLKA